MVEPTREIPISSLIDPDNIRRLVKKTVDTYPLEWKVVHETLISGPTPTAALLDAILKYNAFLMIYPIIFNG